MTRLEAEALFGIDRVALAIEANDGVFDDGVLYALEQGYDLVWLDDEDDEDDLQSGREPWS